MSNPVLQTQITTTVSNATEREEWRQRRQRGPLRHRQVLQPPLLEALLWPFPSAFNWLQLPLDFTSANNKVLKTQFSILQSALLEKVKRRAAKSI